MAQPPSAAPPRRLVDARLARALLPVLAAALLILAATLLILAAGCGKKGAPRPPIRYIPAPTKDLAVRQRGSELLFTLTYPSTTASGQALSGIRSVQIWQVQEPVAAPVAAEAPATVPAPAAAQAPAVTQAPAAETPASAKEPAAGQAPAPGQASAPGQTAVRGVDPREFALRAKQVLELSGAELASATTGSRITARLVLAEEAIQKGGTADTFAVRTVSTQGDLSAFSNQVGIVPRTPPPPPRALTLTPEAGGIRIRWEKQDEVAGVSLYRRQAEDRTYGAPIHSSSGDETEYLDAAVRFGERYIYAASSVSKETPPVESAPAGEVEIDYRDRFAPPPPTGLVALAEAGKVRLVWQPSPAPDVAGYIVYRRDPGQKFRRITPEPVTALELQDSGLGPGLTFLYRVTAVDQTGNEGEPSQQAEARLP